MYWENIFYIYTNFKDTQPNSGTTISVINCLLVSHWCVLSQIKEGCRNVEYNMHLHLIIISHQELRICFTVSFHPFGFSLHILSCKKEPKVDYQMKRIYQPDRTCQCKLAAKYEHCRTGLSRDEFCHISMSYHNAHHN